MAKFDKSQVNRLKDISKEVFVEFEKGLILQSDPNPHDWGDWGLSHFGTFMVRITSDYIKKRHEFVQAASKILKSKSAHQSTIVVMISDASHDYIKAKMLNENKIDHIEDIADKCVKKVLAEAGKVYTHIEPNYIFRNHYPEPLKIGRVSSMPTGLVGQNTKLGHCPSVKLEIGPKPEQRPSANGGMVVVMPGNVWVVEVAATKENVAEEAKWLIDVAISFVRLSDVVWSGHFPHTGYVETHPTRMTAMEDPTVTLDDEQVQLGGTKLPPWYEIDAEAHAKLSSKVMQDRANLLFDSPDKSLAQRVALGLGWMTRGRQTADRSERLLAFFTALEALLTSNDKSDPVTQTISRHASVILSSDVKKRVDCYNKIKGLYAVRSAIVHSGRREALGVDIDNLQIVAEAIYSIVIRNCDLSMKQDRFSQSLADASHGQEWEFASAIE